jgi:hypothetical protein
VLSTGGESSPVASRTGARTGAAVGVGSSTRLSGVGVTVGSTGTVVRVITVVGVIIVMMSGAGVGRRVPVLVSTGAGVRAGAVVTAAVTTSIAVTIVVGSSASGPKRATSGAMGGGVRGKEGRGSTEVAQFASKITKRKSSARRLRVVRDSMEWSVAQARTGTKC